MTGSSSALAPNIQRIKKAAMDTAKAKDHRMTTFTGRLLKQGNDSFFAALCKDCFKALHVCADGTIKGEAYEKECIG
jgi:hypothetical protein